MRCIKHAADHLYLVMLFVGVNFLHIKFTRYHYVLNSDVSALSTCPSLECLHLEHNPIVEDPHYR